MIFVTLGSQKFQFNRLLIEIDKLVQEEKITEEIFAQIGYSDYKPKSYTYKEFLDRDEFTEIMTKCDKVITHGGTGAIIGAVKRNKIVIAVPRLSKFGEHIDDHQLQIISQFKEKNIIESCVDIHNLESVIVETENRKFNSYISNTQEILNSIEDFINERWK